MAKQKQRACREGKEKSMNEHQERTRAGRAVGRRQRAHSFDLGKEQPTERPQSLSHPPKSREADLCNIILAGLRTEITPMVSSCIGGGLDWILGKISLQKEWSGVGTGCPGQWWSPYHWRDSKKRVDVAIQDMV